MNGDPYSPDRPPRAVAYGPLIWGAILVLIGAGWLLAALDIATVPWRALLAAILIIIGVTLVASVGRKDAPDGLFGAGITIALILALLSTFSSAFSFPLRGGVGDRTFTPTIATLEAEYNMLAGQMIIDLSEVDFPAGETRLAVGVTFGRIDIGGIAEDVAVSVEGRATAGELGLLGSHWDGINVKEAAADPDFTSAARQLVIDARVGFGQIEVHR